MCRYLAFLICLSVMCGAAAAAEKEKAPPPSLDKDPSLVGWWKFDDASGKTAVDSSRHRRKAALKGGLSFEANSAPGRIGKALAFDGRDDLVEVAGYKGVTGTRPRTVAFWVKTKRSRGEIVSWGSPEGGKMWRICFIRGRLGVTPQGGYLYMNATTHDGKWHHAAMVVRKAKLPNLHDDVTLYLDGAVAEIHDIGLLDLWPVETGSELDVRIGKGFSGLIDDLRIYDRPLSRLEIIALFRLQSDKPLPKR